MKYTFRTIAKTSEGFYKDKGSKFIAFAHPVSSIEDAKELNKWYRIEFFDARHHCFAYLIDPTNEQSRAADDGEPSNSAGSPILGQIRSFDLSNVMVMVVRYFGGTKLGVPGLVTAYKSASFDALNLAEIIEIEIKESLKLSFSYQEMDKVMRVIKQFDLEIVKQEMQLDCSFDIKVPLSKLELVKIELEDFILVD